MIDVFAAWYKYEKARLRVRFIPSKIRTVAWSWRTIIFIIQSISFANRYVQTQNNACLNEAIYGAFVVHDA